MNRFALPAALGVASLLPHLYAAPKTMKTLPKRPAASSSTTGSTVAKKPAAEVAAVRWMKSMTPREKAAQLIVIPFSGHPLHTRSREYRKFIHLVAQEHVGGLILINVANGRISSRADPLEVAGFLNAMQRSSKIPLLVAGDFERGASMRVDDTTVFPYAMALAATRDPNSARIEGEITAREARAIGVQWLLFPDADVNNNPDNPIINIRSFGEDPKDVSQYVSAFIDGAHGAVGAKVLVTAKHFPGHGDTATDTHMNLASIAGDLPRLEAVEWMPFRAAIQSGVDSIMSAHIAVPALDVPTMPATLSPKILTGILREELHFKGIIITDALDMGGIAQGFQVGDAAVRALEAGADVLLMPSDPEAAINALVAALKSGRLTQKRLDESVLRILSAKVRLGLATKKLVDLDEIHSIVNSPESNAAAQQISDRSVTLVRNAPGLVPLSSAAHTAFLLMAESRTSSEGQAFAQELKKHGPNAGVALLDSSMSDGDLQAAIDRSAGANQYVVAAFASVAANRGNVALGGGFSQLVQNLIATRKPVTMIALGNPYLLRSFPGVAAYMTTYSTVPPSELSAVKALMGEIGIAGKLPVTIPDFANYGDGIVLRATSSTQ